MNSIKKAVFPIAGLGLGFLPDDIGTAWPGADSVAEAFYERGWCGINIEPNPELNLQSQRRRLHDRNLLLAVGGAKAFSR